MRIRAQQRSEPTPRVEQGLAGAPDVLANGTPAARHDTAGTAAVHPPRGATGSAADDDAPAANRWTVFAMVSVGLFMVSLDQTIVSTALPTLHHDLHTPINWAGWTITGYQLGMAAAMPLLGRVSDQFGRKRVFIICAALFIVSSLACGFATNIEMLIPFRVLQSLGGGGFMPSATGIISDTFKRERERPIGLFTSILPFGSLVGPTIGGLIINFWSWRGVFFINIPIGVVLIVLLARILPESKRVSNQSIDVLGAIQLAIALAGVMLGLSELGTPSSAIWSPPVFVPILVSIGAGALFVRHLRHHDSPIIPVALLARREFAVMNVLNTVFGVVGLGIGTLVPLYAEVRYHISPLSAGTLLSSRGLTVILLSTVSAYSIRRTGYRIPMIVGFTFIGLGVVGIGITSPIASAYAWLAIAAAVTGVGIGIALPSTNNASLSLAPKDIAAAAGLRGTCRQFGAIVGVSIATALTARSAHEGLALGHVYLYFAVLVIPLYVLTAFVSERRGAW